MNGRFKPVTEKNMKNGVFSTLSAQKYAENRQLGELVLTHNMRGIPLQLHLHRPHKKTFFVRNQLWDDVAVTLHKGVRADGHLLDAGLLDVGGDHVAVTSSIVIRLCKVKQHC